MDSLYPRGSEWRKWDLHIHTPFSVLNNQFPNDWDGYVKNLFNKAIENNIVCIGITDYFSIEGYKKIKQEYIENDKKLESLFAYEIQNDSKYIDKIKSITLLPNIELRIDKVITSEKNGKFVNSKLEYHLIISDKLSISQIEENILCQLYFSGESSTCLGTDKKPITRNNIETLGAKLKKTQIEFQDKSDYVVGCNCASVDFDEMTNAVKKNFNELNNNILFVLVEDDISKYRWNDSAHMVRKKIYSNSHLIFSSNKKTSSWGLQDNTKNEFSSYKGCIWGSDAHSYARMFNPDNENFCWIKADPTFEGLIQATIHPHDRFFIGNIPPSLDIFNKNKAHYIKNVRVNRNAEAKNPETWFNADIPMNSGLVAIIGNKGSGKSALSDIIGYLCHCSSMDKASFLDKDRFLRGDKKFAADYSGELEWGDGHKLIENSLLEHSDSFTLEYAKYLPQKYIENTCGNLGDEFQNEVNKVIFSYIDASEKVGCQNLEELIEKKSFSIYEKIQSEQLKIEPINKKIIILEDKSAPSFLSDCEKSKKSLEEELERLIKGKPDDVQEPSKTEDEASAKRILEIESSVDSINQKIETIKNDLAIITENISEIDELITKGQVIKQDVDDTNKRYEIFINKISNKNILPYLTLNICRDTLNNIKNELALRHSSLLFSIRELPESSDQADDDFLKYLEKEYSDSLYFNLLKLNIEKKSLIASVSTEQKRYQKYKEDLKEWSEKKNRIIGNISTGNTIEYCKELIRYINEDLGKDIESLERERNECVKEIYNCYKKISSIYIDLYAPIKSKLEKILNNIDDTINFSADIVTIRELNLRIYDKINKNAKSPLRGNQAALAFIDEQIRSTIFNNHESILRFLNQIISTVKNDPEQLSRVVPDRLDFYNFLYDLKYLSVEYTLKLGNKKIAELSAGERGMLLLVFYLALSKENIPLIIDQPEDNLDNQSVYNRIVPCIMESKKNRQVIIVTHNPNIAIACDAEQIIYCEIDKGKTEISYNSGSIENLFVRKKVIDVLEGTEPAFELRKSKYFFDLTQHTLGESTD